MNEPHTETLRSSPTPVVVDIGHLPPGFGGAEAARTAASVGLDVAETATLARAYAAIQDTGQEPGMLCAPEDQAGALLLTWLAEHAEELEAVRSTPAGGLEARFDELDPRWARQFMPWLRERLGIPHRDRRPPLRDAPATLPAKARLAILGDWGTGLYGAPACGRSIADDGAYDAVVHLGDVYYSGSPKEIRERFLAFWPDVPNAVNRACNSNHEMYSGGRPFFELTLGRFEQPSTVFTLRNDHWLFIGLDTAYDHHDLDSKQTRWLDEVIARRDGRRVVLFSHHQLFSGLSGSGTRLARRLAHQLDARAIDAWYWGHEHRCVVYEPHPNWGLRARCIGHSGFPYFRRPLRNLPGEPLPGRQRWCRLPASKTAPAALALDGPNEYVGDRADRYGPNGYLRLELDGPTLNEVLLAPDGTVLWERELA